MTTPVPVMGDANGGFVVELEQFSGPLDLLLHLIREDELDITDLPIAKIADQFLAAIGELKLNQAADYLEMAARLLRIKAQMLLPRRAGDDEWEDPRAELVRRLLEYQQIRELVEWLGAAAARRAEQFGRGFAPPPAAPAAAAPLVIDLNDVLGAAERVIALIPEPVLHRVVPRPLDVEAPPRGSRRYWRGARRSVGSKWSGNALRSSKSCPRSSRCSSSRSAASCRSGRMGHSRRSRSAVSPLAQLLEAALFAAARPLSVEELLALEPEAGAAAVDAALVEIRDIFAARTHGIELVEIGDGWQFLTRRDYAEAIERAEFAVRPRRLSPAALETLAIIAYRQPVGRIEVDEIRGVDSGAVIDKLVERGLVEIVTRGEGLGRPLLYGTTPQFLETLGLKDLEELPRLEELSVALRPPAPAEPE